MEALGFQCLSPVVDWSAILVELLMELICRKGKGRLKQLERKERLKERLDTEGEKGCDAMGA